MKIIDTPVFSTPAPYPCEDNDTEPFSKIFYDIEEHIGRDLRPFCHTESFQILDILRLNLWTAFFNSNHRFSMWSGDRWPLQNVDFVVN